MTNPELFDVYAGVVLADLYERFPVPGSFEPEPPPVDGPDPAGSEDVWLATLYWLEAEGYIRIRSKTIGGRCGHVTLSEKSLAVLKSMPSVLGGSEPEQPKTLGARLIEATKSTGAYAKNQAVAAAIGEIVKLGIRHMGAG